MNVLYQTSTKHEHNCFSQRCFANNSLILNSDTVQLEVKVKAITHNAMSYNNRRDIQQLNEHFVNF